MKEDKQTLCNRHYLMYGTFECRRKLNLTLKYTAGIPIYSIQVSKRHISKQVLNKAGIQKLSNA
jgi:hypothetical protein